MSVQSWVPGLFSAIDRQEADAFAGFLAEDAVFHSTSAPRRSTRKMNKARYCLRCGSPLAERVIADIPRLACGTEGCGYVFWDNPLPVVAGLVELGGQVVLARNHAWPEKMFGIITGFLERGETPEEAVAREVKEELDLDALAVSLIGVYPFQRKNEVIIAYHVVAGGDITLNEELAEFRLVAPEKLRPWDFGTGLAIKDWLRWRGVPG